MENCLFCRIVEKKIPAKIVYEDDFMLAFHDIAPIAAVHILLIPKIHIASLSAAQVDHCDLLGKMLLAVNQIASEQNSRDGFRLITNNGKIGRQEVMHLHFHILGGETPLGAMLAKQKANT